MKFHVVALSAAVLATVAAVNLPVDNRVPATDVLKAQGYTISPMNFKGKIGPHEVNFNGTVEELMDHVEKEHPGFDRNSVVAAAGELVFRHTQELTTRSKDGVHCCPVAGQPFSDAYRNDIQGGIQYLQGVAAQGITCGVGAAGTNAVNKLSRNCVRISCSDDSAIFLCNDNGYIIQPNCAYIASYAQDLINSCTHYPWFVATAYVCGQEFDTDNYNVVVSYDRC